MKKFYVVVIGIVFLLAGLYTPIFADSGNGGSSERYSSAERDSPSNFSVALGDHFIEIYTCLDSTKDYADKYFFEGETINLTGSIYLAVPGPVTAHTIVTDAGGKVLNLYRYDFTASHSYPKFWYDTNTLTSGTYNFNVLVVTADGLLLSPTAFTFVVLPSPTPGPLPF